MFQPENKNDEISKLFGNVLKSSDDDFKYRLINALAKLDDSGWDNLEKLLDTIYEKKWENSQGQCANPWLFFLTD